MPALISTFENSPCYLSNAYEMLPLLLKCIGTEQDSRKFFCQGYHLLPWQPDFRRHIQSNFDFNIASFNQRFIQT